MTDESLDREIREAVEPSAATVDRVLATILGDAAHRSPGIRRWLPLGAAATVALVLVAALFTARRAPQPAGAARIRITNVGETIVVQRLEGATWLIGRGTAEPDGLAPGTVIAYGTGGR